MLDSTSIDACYILYRDDSQSEYSFCLEAAISTSKQVDEDRLTYLNKGTIILSYSLSGQRQYSCVVVLMQLLARVLNGRRQYREINAAKGVGLR